MSVNTVWSELYNNVMLQDAESQLNFLSLIGEKIRDIPVEYLLKEQALFIPNDSYVQTYGGLDSYSNENGFYYNGISLWSDYLIFPIRNISNDAMGIGGFCARLYLQAKETNDYSISYYNYSTKSIFRKGNYLFWGVDGFENAYNAGYIILVDGLFDAIQLRRYGYHAAALMGSSLTEVVVAQLRFFKKVIIISDNDTAGLKLEDKLKRRLNNCVYLRQGFDKDIDGAFKNASVPKLLKAINEVINEPFLIDRVIR